MDREVIQTTADRLREEGRQEGRRIGYAEGRRMLVIHVLRSRFGELPEPVLDRVRSLSLEEVDAALRLAPLAESLAEVVPPKSS